MSKDAFLTNAYHYYYYCMAYNFIYTSLIISVSSVDGFIILKCIV